MSESQEGVPQKAPKITILPPAGPEEMLGERKSLIHPTSSVGQRNERAAGGNLQVLADAYRTQDFIVGGVSEKARKNNRLVVESIQAAAQQVVGRENEVFAIHLGGSRVKGYNTETSDVDLIVVEPEGVNSGFVYDAVRAELRKRGLANGVDGAMGLWANYPIKTDPEEFLYMVDHHGGELIALFGNTLYANPNLTLTRLAALEVINRYIHSEYDDWNRIRQNYAETYLGEYDHLVPKIAERYGEPVEKVRTIFNPLLLRARHKKFGLRDPKTLLGEDRKWFRQNEKSLKDYKMLDTYKGVLELLPAS